MGTFAWLAGLARGSSPSAAALRPKASGSSVGMSTEDIRNLIRHGSEREDWAGNSAHLRCVTIIANALGTLPCHLNQLDGDGNATGKAREHPVYRLLVRRPNHYQTPMTFKRSMTIQALLRGNAYALPIRVNGRVTELIPFAPGAVRTQRNADLSVTHVAQTPKGQVVYKPGEILHLMGPSECGIRGLSMMDAAKDTLALWRESTTALRAANRQGANPGGALEFPPGKTLSDEALARLKHDANAEYAGSDNAGKWMVLEDGLTAKMFTQNLRDQQAVEARNQQVEDIARIYGVPRPFLMLDDTSWGSGIEQLAIFFVQYALAPWMVAWEQALMMTLMSEADFDRYQIKFNERALLRGSMKDQAEYLSKLLGGTQSPGVIDANEGRAWLDLPPRDGAGELVRMAQT